MSRDFEWQTGEDHEWEDSPTLLEPHQKKIPRLGLKTWLILLVIMFAIAGLLYWYLDANARRNEELMRADLLQVHQLVIDAVGSNDYESYELFVGNGGIAWEQLQPDLLRQKLILDRTSLGLKAAPQNAVKNLPSTTVVSFSPAFDQAELLDQRDYQVAGSGSLSETVPLKRHFFYERDGSNWRLISPPADFWGGWDRIELDQIVMIFPERDSDVAAALAPRLELVVKGLCADDLLVCPEDFVLQLHLDKNERSLLQLQENPLTISLRSSNYVELPAPSLVGVPVDDAGIDALFQGYANWIATIIVGNYSGLIQEAEFKGGLDLLVKYDLALPPAPVLPSPHLSLTTWPVDLKLPEQDILMMCIEGQQIRLFRLDLEKGRWIDEFAEAGLRPIMITSSYPGTALTRLPDFSGALLQVEQTIADQTRWLTYLWAHDELNLLIESTEPYFAFPPIAQPAKLIPEVAVFYGMNPETDPILGKLWLIDVTDCLETECELQSIGGVPVWSPDGTRTILIELYRANLSTLYLGDANGQKILPIGHGFSPVWLDEEHFAYLRFQAPATSGEPITETGEELVVASVLDDALGEPATILTTGDILQAIPEQDRPEDLNIVGLTADEKSSGQWHLLATNKAETDEPRGYLIRYDENENDLRILHYFEAESLVNTLLTSPDGRYFATIGINEQDVYLHFVEQSTGMVKTIEKYIPSDWSVDGAWLLFPEMEKLVVRAVESDFEFNLEHGLSGCYSAVWINQ